MKKLILLCTLTLVFSFTSVFGATGYYDTTAVAGVGYNTFTGDRDITGYYSTTKKNKIVSDTIILNNLDNFHWVVFFNKNNQVIGFMKNGNTRAETPSTVYNLGTIESLYITPPDGAYSFAFQSFDYERYVEEVITDLWPEEYSITTDKTYLINDIDDTVYTANGVEYSLNDFFGSDITLIGGENNLFTNGDFSTSSTADWVNLNGGVINDGRLEFTGYTSSWHFESVLDIDNSSEYFFSYDVVENNVNARLWIELMMQMENEIEIGDTLTTYYTIDSVVWDILSGIITGWENLTFIYSAQGETLTYDVALDNFIALNLTELTESGFEPSQDMILELFKAWKWLFLTPEYENIRGYIPPLNRDCIEYNPWASLFVTDADTYTDVCTAYGLNFNEWEWQTDSEVTDVGYITLKDVIIKENESLFYSSLLSLDDSPKTLDISVGIEGQEYYNKSFADSEELNIPFTDPLDTWHYFSGLETNVGHTYGKFKLVYDYFLPTDSSTSLISNYWWVLDPFTALGLYDYNYTDVYNALLSIKSPARFNESLDSSYNSGPKALTLSYYTVLAPWYDEPFTTDDLESIVASYDYTPVVYDRDVDDGVDTYLDNIGLLDSTSKMIIGASLIAIVTIVLAIITSSAVIIILGDIILYIALVFFGWFESWPLVVIGLLLVILFGFSLLKKGGHSSD